MKRFMLFLPIYLCLIFTLSGQDLSLQKADNLFTKTFSKDHYLADLDELAQTLTETHPAPFKFTSKSEFVSMLKKNKQAITDKTTYSEFLWACSEIVASLDCGHTSLGYFNQESRILPLDIRFPLEARWVEGHLYITDPLINGTQVQAEDEILKINGKDVAEIKEEVYRHISSQGKNQSYKRMLFNGYFTAYIPYALGFPSSYSLQLKGKQEAILLDKLSAYQYKARISPNNPCQENLCLSFLPEKKAAVLSIRSFAYYGDKFPVFQAFIDDSFQKIKQKGIKKLVLDVRMNGGGPSDAGIYVLKYLAKKPFTYFASSAFDEKTDPFMPLKDRFQGKVYILMDGEGTSTTGHFISLVKDLKLATLVGEELGSNQYCTGGQKEFQLTHTKVSYHVGRYTYVSAATSFPEEKGIDPDHYVVQSVQDFIKNKDTVMEYALRLIKN